MKDSKEVKREGISITSWLIIVMFLCSVVLFEYNWFLVFQTRDDLGEIKDNLKDIQTYLKIGNETWRFAYCEQNELPIECIDTSSIRDYTEIGGNKWAFVKLECLSELGCTAKLEVGLI